MKPTKRRDNCAHCGRLRYIQGRGLCERCHRDPETRADYVPQFRRWSEDFHDVEMLAADGADIKEVCRRLGCTEEAFYRACIRHERTELYWRLADRCDTAVLRRNVAATKRAKGAA
ncbi:hypothetical protein [Nocardioides sp.]|uniref:hypothetical protein n=1 Tax=Nocardioides sp. TaxID=35761 RepID=UPI0035158454